MSKPRIIILMHYMELGGAEMALIGLLHALDPEKVDVDLFIYSHQGPLMRFIPEWVNLLPEKPAYSVIERPMTEALRRGQFGVVLGRLLAKLKHKAYIRKHPPRGDDASQLSFIGKYVTKFLPMLSSEIYDLCISFLLPHEIGLYKVNTKKRLAWIHTDYSKVAFNTDIELPVWNEYDKIASISDEVTNAFLKSFPETRDKIIGIENILPSEYVKKRSFEFDASKELSGSPIIVSVGRLCHAKNYDNVPDIARRIVESGVSDLKWYIIGFGGDESLIRQKIAEAGMEERVILLGKKDNPYPYIKACDIYVQPSRYEGKSITVREAQMLCKPVAVTAYPTAPSQIKDGIDGVIVPQGNEGAANGLINLINDKVKQEQLSEYLLAHDYGNENEVNKIYKILDVD